MAKTPLSESHEDYLEAIWHLVQEGQVARARDIARRLAVTAASVTGALHALADRGLINYAPYELVTLTPAGEAAARGVSRRHQLLRDFFVRVLATPAAVADTAACRMEHSMPPEVLERLAGLVEFVDRCPRSGPRWLGRFQCGCRPDPRHCRACVGALAVTAAAAAKGAP